MSEVSTAVSVSSVCPFDLREGWLINGTKMFNFENVTEIRAKVYSETPSLQFKSIREGTRYYQFTFDDVASLTKCYNTVINVLTN